ncbi:hypothetical protein [Nocardiopsis nanhaiensis]
MGKKHVHTEDHRAEQRKQEILRDIGTAYISGGLQNDAAARAHYPAKVKREVLAAGGDTATAKVAEEWAQELVQEVEADRSHQGLAAARRSAEACAEEIAGRVHDQIQARDHEGAALSDEDLEHAVMTGRRPGGLRERAAAAAAQGPAGPREPATEEQRLLLAELNEPNREKRREMREARGGKPWRGMQTG